MEFSEQLCGCQPVNFISNANGPNSPSYSKNCCSTFEVFPSLFESETTNQGPPGILDTITLCDCTPVPSVIHPEAMMDTVQETEFQITSMIIKSVTKPEW